MTDAKRQKIQSQIAAGEARHMAREDSTLFDRVGEKAIEAKDNFTAFAREHPLTTVAAGVAVGVLISALFPRSPTRRLGTKAAGLAALGAETAMAYFHHAKDHATQAGHDGAHRWDDWSDLISETARRITRDAASLVESAGESARDVGDRVSRHIPRRH